MVQAGVDVKWPLEQLGFLSAKIIYFSYSGYLQIVSRLLLSSLREDVKPHLVLDHS